MRRLHVSLMFGIVALAFSGSTALAGGRTLSGGHPYHNGYHFIPPASAYEQVWFRPPVIFGAPAYYYPESYLYGVPRTITPYTYAPVERAGAYYMSAYGVAYSSPW